MQSVDPREASRFRYAHICPYMYIRVSIYTGYIHRGGEAHRTKVKEKIMNVT
jgi:hypothetical protein